MKSSAVRETNLQPVLGILTTKDDSRIFRGDRPNFIDFIRLGKQMGILVYVLAVQDAILTHKYVFGYTFSGKRKRWVRQLFPLPHIIYNRIPFRKHEQYPESQRIIEECLEHPQIHFFNPAFFNKWHLFEWLRKSNATKQHIPATHKLNNNVDLRSLLQQHSSLYLKPERGKAGRGIMMVKRMYTHYVLSIQDSKGSQTFQYPTFPQLWNKIVEAIGNKEYIVQQGISLAKSNQRPFDLRALVQKNHKGLWELTGIGARVAGEWSITTHVPRGGMIDNPVKLLASAFTAERGAKILNNAKRAALRIAKQIEKGSGYVIGEMSLDLGVDTSGHVWFFEANSKPMKFDEPLIRVKSLKNVLDYCVYLTNNVKK